MGGGGAGQAVKMVSATDTAWSKDTLPFTGGAQPN